MVHITKTNNCKEIFVLQLIKKINFNEKEKVMSFEMCMFYLSIHLKF